MPEMIVTQFVDHLRYHIRTAWSLQRLRTLALCAHAHRAATTPDEKLLITKALRIKRETFDG